MSDLKPELGSEQLEVLLWQRLGRRARDVRVLVRCDGVVLQGHVESWYSKQLAQQLTKQLTGRLILNEIEVQGSPAKMREE